MKTMLFAAVLAAFTFTACEKNTQDLPNLSPIQEVASLNTLTPPESATKWIAANFPDYTIRKTTTTYHFQEVFYNVTIHQNEGDGDVKIILFNANGDVMSIQHL